MQLTPNFSLEEFVATQHRNIDNTLPQELMPNAVRTCQMLERIRDHLSHISGQAVRMYISSGYRCIELNDAVGSKPTSDHVRAFAADWTAPTFGTPLTLANVLQNVMDDLQIGQLIHEFGRWVHVGVSEPANPINRVITIDRYGTRAGILEVRP